MILYIHLTYIEYLPKKHSTTKKQTTIKVRLLKENQYYLIYFAKSIIPTEKYKKKAYDLIKKYSSYLDIF